MRPFHVAGKLIFLLPWVVSADAQEPQAAVDEVLEAARSWVLGQPSTFENEVLFEVRDGDVVRSGRYAAAGVPPGDFDGDGDIDLHDYYAFQVCQTFSGPEIPIPAACDVFDSDVDDDVDMDDLAVFTAAWAGTLCEVDADCDDGDPCTVDACVDNECEPAPVECPVGQHCDLSTGECVPDVECVTNEDCDDELFCTGVENCVDGFCISTGNPCGCELCDEDLDICSDLALDFTLGVDNLFGTCGNDTFQAPLIFHFPTGRNVPSLQTGDSANGGEGDDVLSPATLNFTAATNVQPTLTSIETMMIFDFGTAATTIHAANISGLTSINTLHSTNSNALSFNSLSTVVDAAITNNSAGLSLGYVASATSGTSDDMNLTLSNVAGGTLTITTATTNGIETMSVVSTGAANRLNRINQVTGTTLNTLTVAGDTALTIGNALPMTIHTLNASTDTGGVAIDVSGNVGNVTLTGGSGNDTFTIGANYTTTDTINGGGGTDTLGLTSATAAAASNQTNVTGFEALTVSDGLAANVTASRFGCTTSACTTTALSTVSLQAGFTGAVTLTLRATGSTVNLGARAASNDSTANGTVNLPGLSTVDSLTFHINDSDTNSAYIFMGIETLNMSSNARGDGNAADGGLNSIGGALTVTPTFGTGTINLTGATNLTIVGAVTAGALTAITFSGNLVMSTASANAIVISSGSGNDTLFGSPAGDSLNGGAGANVFEGRAGVDSVTCGSGIDTIRILNATGNGADRKLVSGFTVGSGGDVVNIDGDGLSVLDGTDNFATASSIQAHGSAGNLTVAAASEIVRITAGAIANLTEANSLNGTNLLTAIGGTITVQANGNEHLFLIADAAGNTGVYYGDAGADTGVAAGELTLVAMLQGTTLANLVFSNFSNAN